MFSKLIKVGIVNSRKVNIKNVVLSRLACNTNPIYLSVGFVHSDNDIKSLDDSQYLLPPIPESDVAVFPLNSLGEPTFASLGLNNYTPTGFVQYLLENVHVHLGISWWACVGITALLIRTFMVPFFLQQRRGVNKIAEMTTKGARIMADATKAKNDGDYVLMSAKMLEYSNFTQSNMINMFSMYKPLLIQAPIFISVFTALRGIANVPVESLKTGGLWWFTDLTVCDPYYLLPLINALTMAIVLETGAETPASSAQMNKNIKWGLRLMVPVTFLITCKFPSALLIYWICSNSFSLCFSNLLRQKSVRQLFNIPEPIKMKPDIQPIDFKEVTKMVSFMTELDMRKRAEEKRWTQERQRDILEEGLATAAIRKKLRAEMQAKTQQTENSKESSSEEIPKSDKM